MEFETIGKSARTDKILHGYQRFYPREIEQLRDIDFAMIEIGFGHGNSLQLWKQYFPYAQIFIMDDRIEHIDERSIVYKGDQGNLDNLKNFVSVIENNTKLPICFINDDGSHCPVHQITTFDFLFSRVLISGGVYIIEDIETSYGGFQEKKYGLYDSGSIVEKFKLLMDYTNRIYMTPEDIEILEEKTNFVSPETKQNILSISIQQNCIIVHKKDPTRDYAFDNRTYIQKYLQGAWDTWI